MPPHYPTPSVPYGQPWAELYSGELRLDSHFLDRLAGSRGLRIQLALKRLFDVLASGLLVVVLSPVFLVCFIAIKLTSAGPVLFSQKRWGLDQTQFRCLKMRSMYVPGSVPHPSTVADTETGTLVKMRSDPRVTRVGSLLRRTSIDELPQLLNVLRGDMSMVGPRPLVLPMLDPFPELRAVRSIMRPGITGLWQIRNRANNTSALQMVQDDTEYIRSFSLWLDLKILVATPLEVVLGSGAH